MKAKAKLSGMLGKGFDAAKCKTSLKLVVSRIKLLRNKRETQMRQMRRELAQLLETGQDQTARIRVEHVIREEKTISAYDLIEVYCELIVARLPIIESQKLCPIDLQEAISSVIFAGPRCADLTELVEIRKQLTSKYGKEFSTAAIEVRPGCGVSRLIIEKLSVRAPDAEKKIKVLAEVAKEHNIKWEPKVFEEKMQGYILEGPTSFASASNVRTGTSGFSPLPSQYPENNSNIKMSMNNVTTDTSNVMFSDLNVKGPSSAVHPGVSEKVNNEVKHAYSREENRSSNHSKWNMEFKDAASAAQAAAVSAERASMAARAAAELASRGNMSRQHSAESYESPKYVSSQKFERTPVVDSTSVQVDSSKGSMFRQHSAESYESPKYVSSPKFESSQVLGSMNLQVDSRRGVHDTKQRIENVQRDSSVQTPDVSHQEPDANSYVDRQGSSSSAQFTYNRFSDETDEEEDEVLHKLDKSNAQPAYSAFPINYDDYSSDDNDNIGSVDASDVVFDRYESDVSSPKQQKSGSLFAESSSRTDPVKGNYYVDYEEAIPKVDLHSPSDDNLQPTYDSDDHESENEDEKEKLGQAEATQKNTFLYKDSSSRRVSIPAVPFLGSTSFVGEKAVEEDKSSIRSSVHPDDDEMKLEKRWRTPGMSVRDNQSGISMRSNQTNPRKSGFYLDESARDPMEKGPSPSASSEKDEFSGDMNLGRLRGGLRQKEYKHPSYMTDPVIDDSNDKQIPSGTRDWESFTSPRVIREERSSEDSVSKVSASKPRASKFYSANKVEDQIPSRSSTNNPLPSFDGLSISTNSDEEEQSPVIRITERGNKNSPASRRTRVVPPSDAKEEAHPRPVGGTSFLKERKSPSEATEPYPGKITESRGPYGISSSYGAKTENPGIESSSVESSSPKPQHNETRQPATSDNDGSSSRNAIPRENNQKNPSHVHQKLPDYDTLFAYFSSLRSNTRPK